MSGGTTITESRSEPWEIQSPYLESGFGEAGRLYNEGAPAYYGGPTLAGFDPSQQAAQAGTLGYALGPEARGQQLAAQNSLIQGLSGTIDPAAYNPMVNALQANVMSSLTGDILPGIREAQVRSQPGGSTRGDLAYNKAISDAVTTGMTKPLADMYASAYNQAQGRAVSSGQLYPSVMQAPLSMYGAAGDVGAARRSMTQEGINRDMARYEYEAGAPQQSLANYMNMIQGNYGGVTTQTTPKDNSAMIGALGSIASAFISDERLKENIEKVGSYKGLNLYKYNYLWSPTKWIGFMAQEVEKIIPEAVFHVNGFKVVDYGKIS